ncbi:hypothetical protein [Sediminitomix flava]|nr:hypothetical protein [Sediminitomix flava]
MALSTNAQEVFPRTATNSPLEHFVLNHPEQINTGENILYLGLAPSTSIRGSRIKVIENEIDSISDEFATWKSKKGEFRAIRKLFNQLHRTHLVHYNRESLFADMFETKEFGCLSGSLLFAHIFERNGIEYQLYSSDVHAFITVQTKEGKKLFLETTDPVNGFIYKKSQVERRMSKHLNANSTRGIRTISAPLPLEGEGLAEKVDIKELSALQYYNLAVSAIKSGEIEEGNMQSKKLNVFYKRGKTLKLNTILEAVKDNYQITFSTK